MAEQRIAFEVVDFEPDPVPAEMDAFPHGQRLLRVRFVDGPIATYPLWPTEAAPFEDVIQEAIASGKIYWFDPVDDPTTSPPEGETPESVPEKMLRALHARQLTGEE
jgi:hypothetical protein